MKVQVDMTKENIKILQNLKNSNLSDINFKVFVEDNKVEVSFQKLEIKDADYININNSFLKEIRNSLNLSDKKYSSKTIKGNVFIIEEITEKKLLLTLSIENTIALNELKAKFPEKSQREIINEFFELGYKSYKS